MDGRNRRVYVCGRYNHEGISLFELSASGNLSFRECVYSRKASYVAFHPSYRYLFATNEVDEMAGNPGGAVTAFAVDPRSGRLTSLNHARIEGKGPCHLSLDQEGRYVYVANYTDGTISVLPVQIDGGLGAAIQHIRHQGAGVVADRQAGPHAHCIVQHPGGRRVLVCDLGVDKAYIYKCAADGTLQPGNPPWLSLPPGSGPRHMVFHPNGRYLYVINELISRLDVLAYDDVNGTLTLVKSLPAVPPEYAGKNYCAAIKIHPTGRFLYCSNRGMDSLVMYRVDAEGSGVEVVGYAGTGGRGPRDFAIDPAGRYLIAANQLSDTLVGFRINQDTGLLESKGVLAQISHPVCVYIV